MQIRNFQLQAFWKSPVSDQQLFYPRQLFLSVVNLTTNTSAPAILVQRASDSGFRPNPDGVLAAAGFSGNTALVITELTFCRAAAAAPLSPWLWPGHTARSIQRPLPAELAEGLSVVHTSSWQVFVQVTLTGIDSWLVLMPVLTPPQHTQSCTCTLLSTTALLYTAMLAASTSN